MRIPYRTRRNLGRAAVALLVAAAVLVLAWLCWVLWLGRYVVYTGDGARLDFSQSSQDLSGTPAERPEEETVSIYYNEGDNAINTSFELAQLTGYYVSGSELKDTEALRSQMQALPAGTAVMLEVKNGFGEFYYSSNVSQTRSSAVDAEQVDGLIKYLTDSKLYAIAKVSAFQDYAYGLNHVDDGLFSTGGAYLWRDDEGCYWLNPAREGTVSYLVQIVNELKALGFDEVVFDSFWFPGSENYVFTGDRYQTLATVAGTLVSSCATDYFGVSFISDGSFPLPEGRSRLYVRGVEAANVESMVQSTAVPDPIIRLVFLTELHDTRFDAYSVLRPISAAH